MYIILTSNDSQPLKKKYNLLYWKNSTYSNVCYLMNLIASINFYVMFKYVEYI